MPARGTILLRKPETEERFAGGNIIIPEAARERLANNQMLVVEIGQPEICAYPLDCDELLHRIEPTEIVHPIDPRIIPGAWVIIRPRSLVELPDGYYLVRQNEVYGVFRDPEAEAIARVTEASPKDLFFPVEDVT